VPKRASITEEYCVNDFAISRFAAALGDEAKRVTYQNRAQNWKKLFNATSGYIEPRESDGTFDPKFKPAATTGFVEGSAAQYLWLVNFNFAGLIQSLGGDQAAIGRLDEFFKKLNGPADSTNAFMGNEPCEEAPWTYVFAGAPSKTQEVVRRIQNELFLDAPEGLPGNDDAGALSSWYVFSAIGLYPAIPGVGGLVVGSPRFPSTTIHLANGAAIQIDGENGATDAPYVQDLKIDGKAWTSPWIDWAALEFSLGKSASAWGTRSGATRPPSFDEAGGGQAIDALPKR
jgi:predicted alpha-1,2-mannosidase